MISTIWKKLLRKTTGYVVSNHRNKNWYFYLYPAYWKSKLTQNQNDNARSNPGKEPSITNAYLAAIPNPGAGIGHQIANWIAGYWYAKQFNLKFCHVPFSSTKWESCLGFGLGEQTLDRLRKLDGFNTVRLPFFDEHNGEHRKIVESIVDHYRSKKVVLLLEQDQFYQEQFGVMEDIVRKFHGTPSRREDSLLYDASTFNIALHVRRGDIVQAENESDENLKMRWQGNSYFENVLGNVLQNIGRKKPVKIFIFSQGVEQDYPEFKKFNDITFCLEMSAMSSFVHMVFADLIITSKSSFSYKPALLSRGVKVCPKNFWHGYPKTSDWLLVDDSGNGAYNVLRGVNE